MIDLTGPLVRARLTMLLGGRPFRVERIKGDGVVLTLDHEHTDDHARMPLTAELLEHEQPLRSRLETMVAALDRNAFPDRHRRILEASQEVSRILHTTRDLNGPWGRPAPIHRDAWRL